MTELICSRCGTIFENETSAFYDLTCKAVFNPAFREVALEEDLDPTEAKRQLLEQLESTPASDLERGVHLEVQFRMCAPCFGDWSEDPAGNPKG